MAVDPYGSGEPEAWQPPQTADRASISCPVPALLSARIERLDLGGGGHAMADYGITLRCATSTADRDRAPTGLWRMPRWMPSTRSTRAWPTQPGSTITGWAARTTSPPTARPPKR